MRWRKALAAPFRAVGGGLKAAMRWTGQSRYWWQFLLPRTKFDYASEVGDGTTNSIVSAVLLWMARTFPEAPVIVAEETDDAGEKMIPRHPLAQRIERPNSYYSGPLLWMATIIDWAATGNAYWIKVRDRLGGVAELWWAPSWTLEPKWPEDGSAYVSHYEYQPDSGRDASRYAPQDVVHFRYGLDPENTRKGMSQLRAVLKEIFTDEEAATFTAALIRNLGIPGVLIAPEGANVKVNEEAAKQIKDDFKEKFGGDRRGEPMVMTAPTKVQVMSFSPEQMELKGLRRIPEERISAIFGVAAVVVGLGAGLDRSTFTNFAEAREAAYEGNVIPSQRLIAADLTVQLLPDFESGAALERRKVTFDLRNVRVLQPDMDKLFERMDRAVRGGWAKVEEGKRAVGLPVLPGDDVYLRPFTVVPVRDGAEVPTVAPKGVSGTKGSTAPAFVEQVAQARVRIAESYGPQMAAFFESQAKRAIKRLDNVVSLRSGNGAQHKDSVVGPKTLLPDEEDGLLTEALRPLWLAGVSTAWGLAADGYGLEQAFNEESAAVAYVLSEASHRAGRINDGTRAAIGAALDEGQRRSYTLQQIALGVPDDEFAGLRNVVESYYEGRPETIAQTEAVWSTNMGTAAAYRGNGIARVEMIDGVGGTSCAPCSARNGAIVSLSAGEAASGSAHPNCMLTLAPVAGGP